MLPSGVLAARMPLVRILKALHIPYHVGGSVASSLWGIVRSTRDADVIAALQLDQVAPLVAALEADYYIDAEAVREAIRYRRSFNALHLDTMFKVDVFMQGLRPFDQSALARARPAPLDHVGMETFLLTSPEDIILQKLVWYRMGGEQSERQWLDVLEVLKVQAPHLDRPYLHEWAPRLQVADLMAEAERAADPAIPPPDPT